MNLSEKRSRKPKTLKDIELSVWNDRQEEIRDDIREIAKEWINWLSQPNEEQWSMITPAVTGWIKHFFNLEDI